MASFRPSSLQKLPDGAIVHPDGSIVIPASRRADGSLRKEVRVRQGYVPQEEVPTFQTRSQRGNSERDSHMARSALPPGAIPGMSSAAIAQLVQKQQGGTSSQRSTQSTRRNEDATQALTSSLQKLGITKSVESASVSSSSSSPSLSPASVATDEAASARSPSDPAASSAAVSGNGDDDVDERVKQLKALRKKLRQIDELQAKLDANKSKPGFKLNPEQLDKIRKRGIVVAEIRQLESEGVEVS